MKNWEDVKIAPEFNEQGVACYRLTGADFLNEYYIIFMNTILFRRRRRESCSTRRKS